MKLVEQKLEEIIGALSTLETSWQDDHTSNVIACLKSIELKPEYGLNDIGSLFEPDFRTGFTIAQLFLGISKDELQDHLGALLGSVNIGAKSYIKNRGAFLAAFVSLGLPEAMAPGREFQTGVERHSCRAAP